MEDWTGRKANSNCSHSFTGDYTKGGLGINSKTHKLKVWSRLGQQLVPAGAGMLATVGGMREARESKAR